MINLLLSFMLAASASTCPKVVKKGDVVPCDGIVLSTEQELKARTDLIYYKELSDRYEKRSEFERELLNLEKESSRYYRSELEKKKDREFWQKALYFMAGAVLTGAVAYGTVQVVR